MKRSASLFLALLVACNFGPKTVDDSGSTDDSGGGGETLSIAEVQQGDYADKTVTLNDVIVVSDLTAEGDGLFLQDEGGGEWSGIYAFVPAGLGDLYLEPGSKIKVTGDVTEFYEWTEFTIADASAITVTGSGDVVATPVDGSTVGDWEPWESVLISTGAVTATGNVDSYGQIALDNGLVMDNLFFDFGGEMGATWTNITGNVGYAFETWQLYPRSEADLEGYVPGAGAEPVTVAEIQQGGVPEDSVVKLEGVVVTTPLTAKGDGFFVQDAGGGEYSGIYIYVKEWTGETIVPGQVVDIEGSLTEYYEFTEIKDATITITKETAEPVATVLDGAPSDWEIIEGALVTFNAVNIKTDVDEYGQVGTNIGDLKIDNLFYQFTAAKGDDFGSVTGVINYSFETWTVNPRSEGDMVRVSTAN